MEARQRRDDGEITDDDLRIIEDEHIIGVIEKQEKVGLQGVTDGEFRRLFFHVDFLEHLDGVEVTYGDFFAYFQKDDGTEVGFRPPTMHVTSQIRHARPIQGSDFDFLSANTIRTPKVCIPAPSMLHFRGGRDAISQEVYPDLGGFFADLSAAYRAEILDLGERGCRYLQMDDTNLAYLCDPEIRQRTADRGEDPDALTRLYCQLVNDAIKDRPEDMVVAVHLCRGNFRSAWVAQGGYEPVAEILFNEMAVDAFFLEYDDERSGDFAPLRLVPKDKVVVLGLMSSKKPAVEEAAELKRRIEEAGQFIDLDQCCLSHQCGFSSTAHGNELTEEDQWAKLARTIEVAGDVWGSEN
jgi:5-methyltetrahydropteroyltriglutamate--homocysteine methyltransferase